MKKIHRIIGVIHTIHLESLMGYVDDNEELEIYIHSSGGDGDVGMAIYDYIKMSGKPATTIALGRIESAALLILAAGKIRKATKNTMFMHHFPTCDSPAKPREIKKHPRMDKMKYYMKNFYVIMNGIGIHKEDIKSQQTYFNSGDALSMGVIHEVIKMKG